MFLTPSSIKLIDPALANYKVNDTDDLERHIQICCQEQFTGRLDFKTPDDHNPQWSLFFQQGHLAWSASEVHPIRRWNRQILQQCPQLTVGSVQQGADQRKFLDYDSLIGLMRQEKIQQNHLASIFAGLIAEILFDLMQISYQPRQRPAMEVAYRRLSDDALDTMLMQFSTVEVWQHVGRAWANWQQAGLARYSPNLAPVIWTDDELRRQTSPFVYHNLAAFADGNWTLRDLAIKLKQPILPLVESIMPYVHQGIMGLTQIGDISYFVEPVFGSLVAYIEDSRFDSATMNHILAQAGYRFINIRDATQALPMLLEQKPDLIFLDLLMPIVNGYELCAQIRRVSAFKETPVVIITSNDGVVDRVRAKLVGASSFLAKPIEQGKILSVLKQYLPA